MSDQEEMDAWELDENGCAPDCPIRLLGEQSGERKSAYPNSPETAAKQVGRRILRPPRNTYSPHDNEVKPMDYCDTGTAARYFKTFHPMVDDPDDETPQERGETQLLNSDEVQSGDLPIDQVIHGDALEVLRRLPSNSVHAIVTDPPAGINFMNKEFDSNRGGRDKWIAWLTDIAVEAKRVLCAGGHAFVWALPRTSHWTATALENAGFEIRDEVSHLFGSDSRVQSFVASLDEEQRNAFAQIVDGMGAPASVLSLFGSGFPKSANISAALDSMEYKRREKAIKQALAEQGFENVVWSTDHE